MNDGHVEKSPPDRIFRTGMPAWKFLRPRLFGIARGRSNLAARHCLGMGATSRSKLANRLATLFMLGREHDPCALCHFCQKPTPVTWHRATTAASDQAAKPSRALTRAPNEPSRDRIAQAARKASLLLRIRGTALRSSIHKTPNFPKKKGFEQGLAVTRRCAARPRSLV